MATGDLNFSKGAFLPGETVNLFAGDVTPSLPDVSLAKSAVAAADGSAVFTGVNRTMTQHSKVVPVTTVGLGATSARRIMGLPSP